jgi:LysR family transcriptional regulator, glycine cleavage system transcriptional activator
VALSPTALSERIRRLEDQAGARLFERSTRSVALTAEGARLLPEARRVLEAHAQALEAIHGSALAAPVELRLGTRYELGLSWLVPALPALETACPGRVIHLRFGDAPELLALLAEGRLDGLIASSRVTAGRFEARELHPEAYALVGERRRLAATPFRGAADAPAHALLDLRPDLPLARYFLDQAGGPGLWPFARIECLGTIAAVRLRVLQGRGLAVLPAYFVAKDLAAGRLLRLLPRVRLPVDRFRLLWAKGHPKAAALARLGEELAVRSLV